MTPRRMLSSLFRVVLDEVEKNPDFGARLRNALGTSETTPPGERNKPKRGKQLVEQHEHTDALIGGPQDAKRPSNRRPPAILDPVQLAREGEQPLRAALNHLSLDQLHDIVADYGMDPGKVVMKWRTKKRIVERIVEISLTRAHKGDAFREQSRESDARQPPVQGGAAGEFLLTLVQAKDDAPWNSAEYRAELADFARQAHAASQRGMAFDSAEGGGGPLGEFIFGAAATVALIKALTTIGVEWLKAHHGRKLRLKVDNVELEAATPKEVDAMVKLARELQDGSRHQQTVFVYNYRKWNGSTNVTAPHKATVEAIRRFEAERVEGTGEEVQRDFLDEEGRYTP